MLVSNKVTQIKTQKEEEEGLRITVSPTDRWYLPS
jgi:hypothetical protein